MADVLRRAVDLLEGDVIAFEGKPRQVYRVWEDSFPWSDDKVFVTFEDSPLIERRRKGEPTGEMVRKPTSLPKERRFLLLESHYVAKDVTRGE